MTHLLACGGACRMQLSAVWSVRDGVLQFLATVTATGDAVVPFSIGNHIALKFPFIDDETRCAFAVGPGPAGFK